MRAGFVRAIGCAALVALAAGCGSSASSSGSFKPSGRYGDGTPAPARATPTETPAVPVRQAARTALERYREYQRIYRRVYETNDSAELASVVMDPLLTAIAKDVAATARKGEIWRFTNVLNPQVQAYRKDGSVVIVRDCVRTLGAYIYSATTGERLRAYRGGTFRYQVVMQYSGGTWKAAQSKQGNRC